MRIVHALLGFLGAAMASVLGYVCFLIWRTMLVLRFHADYFAPSTFSLSDLSGLRHLGQAHLRGRSTRRARMASGKEEWRLREGSASCVTAIASAASFPPTVQVPRR